MEHLTTLAVGIPAFNEEGNIFHLLSALLQQKTTGLKLQKIIVVSDGSTDRTVELARSLPDKRIQVIENRKRQGQNGSQNVILRSCDEDIVVLLNADVLPLGKEFLRTLVQPLLRNPEIGLGGAETIPLPPVTWVEKALFASHVLKNTVSRRWNGGENVLSCRGQARVFAKNFYTQLSWPDSVPEDAYSFFRCQQLQHRFVFVPEAQVVMRLPQSLRDHIRQSHRYFIGHKRLEKHFGPARIRKSYRIPFPLFFWSYLTTWRIYPWQLSVYTLMMILINYFLPRQVSHASRFNISPSSKRLIS